MIRPIEIKQLTADGFTWSKYSPRVATISNELRHFSWVCYFAFDSWDDAHSFFKSITAKHLCSKAKVRESERFLTRFEVKVWSMPDATLELLVNRDRNRIKPKKNLPMPPLSREWQHIRSYDSIAHEAA